MNLCSSKSPFKNSEGISFSENYPIPYLNKWPSEELTPSNSLPRVSPLNSDAALEVKRNPPFSSVLPRGDTDFSKDTFTLIVLRRICEGYHLTYLVKFSHCYIMLILSKVQKMTSWSNGQIKTLLVKIYVYIN